MQVWRTIRFALAAALLAGASAVPAPTPASAADSRVESAVGHFLAARYGQMYEALAAPAREGDADALRLLILITRSAHPAGEYFRSREDWRTYVASTGSVHVLGTGWEDRLAALGDPYAGHLLAGGEPAERQLEAVDFLAGRGEWVPAIEIALSMLHQSGGAGADEAFAAIARSGLHDAAAAALRARLSAEFGKAGPDPAMAERVRAIADFARPLWRGGSVGILGGIVALTAGAGGAGALAELTSFEENELDFIAALSAANPLSRGGGELQANPGAATDWWREALANGRWIERDAIGACATMCPASTRRCERALLGPFIPRAWMCLSPHAALIPDARYRGSPAEQDCFASLFADFDRVPRPGAGLPPPLHVRFAAVRERARCVQ